MLPEPRCAAVYRTCWTGSEMLLLWEQRVNTIWEV